MDKKDMLQAVLNSDKIYDGKFFYAVKTTGIYCRPSCKSKNPSPENISFFTTARQAEKAGYRPCKRCRPDLLTFTPDKDLAETAAYIVCTHYTDKKALQSKLDELPVSRRHLTKLFESHYDMSVAEYLANVRYKQACKLLKNGMSVTDTAMETGFETPSSFSTFFRKQAGVSPAEYQKKRIEESSWCFYRTPVGTVKIAEDKDGITSLKFSDSEEYAENVVCSDKDLYLKDACRQLGEYFSGKRRVFDVPLSLKGTDFQQKIWRELVNIPYGETRTYKQIAACAGNAKASRAVGSANNRNPVLIIVPCHRVVGKDNKLVGYAGGLNRKQFLLDMEKKYFYK